MSRFKSYLRTKTSGVWHTLLCLTETIIHWKFLINNRQQNFALSHAASLSVLRGSRRTDDGNSIFGFLKSMRMNSSK